MAQESGTTCLGITVGCHECSLYGLMTSVLSLQLATLIRLHLVPSTPHAVHAVVCVLLLRRQLASCIVPLIFPDNFSMRIWDARHSSVPKCRAKEFTMNTWPRNTLTRCKIVIAHQM